MKHQYLLVLGACLLQFTACRQSASPSSKIWFYTRSTGAVETSNSTLTPACFIDLEKDGSYTSDLGHFDYGKWVYGNNQIVLTGYRNNKSVIAVDYLTGHEMQTGPPTGPFDYFESQPASFASPAANPFSKENNRWRIKAGAREETSQLKNRLRNHFRFWELYFTWAYNSHIQYIDVRSTPTPIKIYGNGFALKKPTQLPDTWKGYFFDEENCLAANRIIQQIFDSKTIAWPQTESKYTLFISAFRQLQEYL